MVGGRIFKRIGREYKGRNHDSDRIELKISWLRSDLCDQIFRLIFFGRVPFDQSWLNASQPWPWVEKFQILGGPTYFYMGDSHFVWETAILYGHHPQLRNAVWSKQACMGGSRDSNPRKRSILGSTYQLGYSAMTTGGPRGQNCFYT